MSINSLKRNRTFIDQRLGQIESDSITDPIASIMKEKIAFSINLTQCPKCLGTEHTVKFRYCDILKDTVCSACYWDARGKIKRTHMKGTNL